MKKTKELNSFKVLNVGNIKTGSASVSEIMNAWNGEKQDRDPIASAQWEAGVTEPVMKTLYEKDYFSNFPWRNMWSEFIELHDDYYILHPTRPCSVDWVESYAGHVLSLTPSKLEDGYMWYPAVKSWEPIVTPLAAISRHNYRDELIEAQFKNNPRYLKFSFWDNTNVNELSEFVGEFSKHNHVIHKNANRLMNYGTEESIQSNIETCLKIAKILGTEAEAKDMIDRVIKRYL